MDDPPVQCPVKGASPAPSEDAMRQVWKTSHVRINGFSFMTGTGTFRLHGKNKDAAEHAR